MQGNFILEFLYLGEIFEVGYLWLFYVYFEFSRLAYLEQTRDEDNSCKELPLRPFLLLGFGWLNPRAEYVQDIPKDVGLHLAKIERGILLEVLSASRNYEGRSGP